MPSTEASDGGAVSQKTAEEIARRRSLTKQPRSRRRATLALAAKHRNSALRASVIRKPLSPPLQQLSASDLVSARNQTISFAILEEGSLSRSRPSDSAAKGRDVELGDRAISFTPRHLIDVECDRSIMLTSERFLGGMRFVEVDSNRALVVNNRTTAPIAKEDATFFAERADSLKYRIERGDVAAFDANDEVRFLGFLWRAVLRSVLAASYDEVNASRLTRPLQFSLPYLSGHESYLIAEVIEAMDCGRKSDVRFVLQMAFRNRNVSRTILQVLRPRWDFLWHTGAMVTFNRLFDAWGRLPVVGITGFGTSENFVSTTRNFAIGSIFRLAFGRGSYVTRFVTRGRESLLTDDPNNVAQNLAAESNGFELSNRNQFGTYNGRLKTNWFRMEHRLTIDESIVRTFVSSPTSTLLNNGVEHTIRQLAKHWHNMLHQPSGNFAHQRMEQLNPFETLRFHMPVVLVTLSNLRGRTTWDGRVLGPFITQLQQLKPSFTADAARHLCRMLKENIVIDVCGGIATRVDPLMSWVDAIAQALDEVEAESKLVFNLVTTVEIGIRMGYDIATQASWKVPSDAVLNRAILAHIEERPTGEVNRQRIRTAMTLITPRDKRTLIELVKKGLARSRPAKLLLGRATTLLQRELRREHLNQTIRKLSRGECVHDVIKDEWYVLEGLDGRSEAYVYDAKVTGEDQHRFVHVNSQRETFVSLEDGSVQVHMYVPIAEAITRAQRVYMYVELDHGKKFSYNAFMEFAYLRRMLERLAVVGQIACELLDDARLNLLFEIQRSNQAQISIYDLEPGKTYYVYDSVQKSYDPFVCKKKYSPEDPEWNELAPSRIVRVPPQSIIVIGGGPTGLMTTVHCCENVLVSGGEIKLYEARDAFTKAGSTFERAQIVRLDSRWVAMLRYHLGTGYEDVYTPASGETNSQLGNTLPAQGFVEITIKDLENMLHVEVSKMNSKGLLQHSTGSGAVYDVGSNALTKVGANLKKDDLIRRRVDPDGKRSNEFYAWRVVKLDYIKPLTAEELQIGNEYGVYVRSENRIVTYRLSGIDLDTNDYTFKPVNSSTLDLRVSSLDITKGAKEDDKIKATGSSLPTVYPKGTTKHGEIKDVTVESIVRGSHGGNLQEKLSFSQIRSFKFRIDTGHTHVVEAIGKPHDSKVHFCSTTHEPYGVCCIQGLKISMGMHNFGNKRWGAGLIDDIRSQTDQNTRVVGDFTKMVRSYPIVRRMHYLMTNKKNDNWQRHFRMLVEESQYSELNISEQVVPKIREACKELMQEAPNFRRQTLQTRFFETGDNYYLGMEFNREYDRWKQKLGTELVASLVSKARDGGDRDEINRFRGVLMHHIDRLWYEGCLEVIRKGDVYNPGARKRVPRIYLTDQVGETPLGKLPVGESFRIADEPKERYEVVVKKGRTVFARNVEGYIYKMSMRTRVRLGGNLTRGPDGNAESRVSISTFPVAHHVNFRTMRLNDSEKGYVFAFLGDEQATPHFMRYSGLTGACINAMLFNNFVKQAIDGVPFRYRFRSFSRETNWSNGEVVMRGTGANFGEDGFLRPGFSYDHGLDYLHSKVIEHRESGQDMGNILSRDWKNKLAAALIPRGMETNEIFAKILNHHLVAAVMRNFVNAAAKDEEFGDDGIMDILKGRAQELEQERMLSDFESYWNKYMSNLAIDEKAKKVLEDRYVFVAKRLEQICTQLAEHAKKQYFLNERISSELFNQPKSVDTVFDDFPPEAQSLAISFARSASFSAGALAFCLFGGREGSIVGVILAGINIATSFSIMANSARYQVRNEEARVDFFDANMDSVKQGVFSIMNQSQREAFGPNDNPFVLVLMKRKDKFVENVKYYDYPEPIEFMADYAAMMEEPNDPAVIRRFMEQIITMYMTDLYHINSYLQEDLVGVYKACEGMLNDLERGGNNGNHKLETLYLKLVEFEPRLLNDLERTAVRGGFVRKRRWSHWSGFVVLKYFASLFCCTRTKGRNPLDTISAETLGILKQARIDISGHEGLAARATRDLSHLYWATKESEFGSTIFAASFLVFIASIIFTIARIFRIVILEQVAFWATGASFWSVLLVFFRLARKIRPLFIVYLALNRKLKERRDSTDVRESIEVVRKVTRTQIYLTLMRVLFTGGASISLPWCVAEFQWGTNLVSLEDRTNTSSFVLLWIAAGSVVLAVISVFYFFFLEYFVMYHLPPTLGEFVCEVFRDELEAMYERFSLPKNTIEAAQVQDRETWEYVAREFLHKYRFDMVFAADRFGSILQYIQSGLAVRDTKQNQVITLIVPV